MVDPETFRSFPSAEMVEKFYWFVLRAVDSTIALTNKHLYAYTLFPGLIFWSGVQPPQPDGWKGTLIKKRGVIDAGEQQVKQKGFGPFLTTRVKELRGHMSGMSDRQREKIAERRVSMSLRHLDR